MRMRKRFVIVGAGVGGLATALRLAHRGHEVIVLEKTGVVGGRNRSQTVNQCEFDGGPSLMMMLDPFRKLFEDVGERMEDHLQISLCDPSYRVFFRDGSQIEGTPNIARMVDQITKLCGAHEAEKYPKLIGDLGELYRESIPNFVRTNYLKAREIVAPGQLWRVIKHGMLSNLYKKIEKRFEDPRLRMLFTFQTMYLGLSPFRAPFVYGTLTYMEYGEGIWYPQGGLPAISDAIAQLAMDRGAEIRLNCPVARISGKEVELESGEVLKADAVISNADLPYTQRKLERQPTPPKYRNSCSAFVLYLDYEGPLPKLLHHNVFFGRDYRDNLEALFGEPRMPDDPAFYACISKRSEPGRAPQGHENLFLLIPCPNLECPWTETAQESLKAQVFQRLADEVGFDPSRIRGMEMRTPEDWSRELNLHQGAAFGISADLFQSAFFRPKNRSLFDKNLYYVGASTAPGNGLPMVLISAELLEKRLIHDKVMTDGYVMPDFSENLPEEASWTRE